MFVVVGFSFISFQMNIFVCLYINRSYEIIYFVCVYINTSYKVIYQFTKKRVFLFRIENSDVLRNIMNISCPLKRETVNCFYYILNQNRFALPLRRFFYCNN